VHYLSTRNNELKESFLNVLFQGLSKEGGLFLPSAWPSISIENLRGKNYQEIAHAVISPFVQEDISDEDLILIINKTYQSFNHKNIAPLVNIEKNKYILELFYGPTLAFKDYALQFLGNLFSHMLENSNKKITVLGATSGDTGSAAINAFKGKNDIQVFILHPYQMVSEVQRRQMTTVGEKNVHNIAVKGTFDDCQKIVKQLFLDDELQSKTSLTAVNSINWARLIAQAVYYFWAYIQSNQEKVDFIVPSGNFGNVFSARIAKFMGLPIDRLHIATNENDILHRTISEGKMRIHSVKKTHSPSMDIQVSSNFERQLFESAKRDSDMVQKIMQSFAKTGEQVLSDQIVQDMQLIYTTHSVSNSQTLETIKYYNEHYDYLADPHTATGLYVLDRMSNDQPAISLACADPGKFGNAIEEATGSLPHFRPELKNIFDQDEKMTILDNDTDLIKSHILELI
jgi:threonine synthase